MFPSSTYRFTLKAGMQGHEVWALQINLNYVGYSLVEDGDFGPRTESAVIGFQKSSGLVADGIAGPATQKALALKLIGPAQTAYKTPSGLIKGLVEGESGWAVGAVNWTVPGGVDCGWVQRRVYSTDYGDYAFKRAFDGKVQFALLAKSLREQKVKFYDYASTLSHRRAWELAVLDHNWPSAAENYARGKTNWTYTAKYFFGKGADDGKFVRAGDSTFEYRSYDMKTRAQWVMLIGAKGVSTGHEWANYYIDSKTLYVTDWPA